MIVSLDMDKGGKEPRSVMEEDIQRQLNFQLRDLASVTGASHLNLKVQRDMLLNILDSTTSIKSTVRDNTTVNLDIFQRHRDILKYLSVIEKTAIGEASA